MMNSKAKRVVAAWIIGIFALTGCTALEGEDSSYGEPGEAPPELTEALDVTMRYNDDLRITAGPLDFFRFMARKPGHDTGIAIVSNEDASVYGMITVIGVGTLRDLSEMSGGKTFEEISAADAEGNPASFCVLEEEHEGYNKNLWYGLIITGEISPKMNVPNNVLIKMSEVYDPKKGPTVTEEAFAELLSSFREEA